MKYGNRKVTTNDGIIHDSQREAVRWMELNILVQSMWMNILVAHIMCMVDLMKLGLTFPSIRLLLAVEGEITYLPKPQVHILYRLRE